MVSVIMLTYNQEAHVRQALDSVLSQETAFPFEVLVGDDGSTDGTPALIQAVADAHPDRVRFIRRRENVGAAYNAYDLLMRSRGRYLAFCEGDDYWTDPAKLARQVSFLEAHPEFIGCAHRCLLVDEDGRPLARQRLSWVKTRPRFSFSDFQGGKYLPGQTATIVKRNIFLDRGRGRDWSVLYAANRNVSDRMTTAVYLLEGDFACLDETMSAYRQTTRHGGENVTSRQFKDNEDKCRDELAMTRTLEEYASAALGRAIRFSRKRSDILLDALIGFLRRRDGKSRGDVRLLSRETTAGEKLLLFPAAVEKLKNKLA